MWDRPRKIIQQLDQHMKCLLLAELQVVDEIFAERHNLKIARDRDCVPSKMQAAPRSNTHTHHNLIVLVYKPLWRQRPDKVRCSWA